MDARPTPLLSSLVQTRSLERVLAPIASQVSQLLVLADSRGDALYPNLMSSALVVMEAVENMANVAQKIATESADEQLQLDMPVAYEQALRSAQQLLEGATLAAESSGPQLQDAVCILKEAAQGVLEGTVKVLLIWDDGEVRRILRTAEWALDRLGLVQGSKSMRSLVICYGGFSEPVLLLLKLCDKRQKELTNSERKRRLLVALDRLKNALPQFTSAMQDYVKSPKSTPAKNAKDKLAAEIKSALHSLMEAVRFDEEGGATGEEEGGTEEPDNMAGNIMELHRQLAPDSPLLIGAEFDRHIEAIKENSMAVAHVSRDHHRKALQRLCGEVLFLRKLLSEHFQALLSNPEDEQARAELDGTAEQMSAKLCELDRWVADAVVDQVTDAFKETSAPINHLVHAATATPTTTSTHSPGSTSSMSPPYQEDSLRGLSKQVALFRRHSRRLSEVAAYAAQSSTNAKRVQMIKTLAEEVDSLTPRVVAAALSAKRQPSEPAAKRELDAVRQQWASKVHELTTAIDDIIDPEDFMVVSEANIHQDMARCRDAIQSGKWHELAGLVQGIAGKARRVLEVAKAAASTTEHAALKHALLSATQQLEKAVSTMLILANELIANPGNQNSHDKFVESLRQVLQHISSIRTAFQQQGQSPGGKGAEPVAQSPTPLRSVPERMAKGNVERLRSSGSSGSGTQQTARYIGTIGSRAARQKRVLPSPPSPPSLEDEGTQTWDGPSHEEHTSGDIHTQTPWRRVRDQSSQADTSSLGNMTALSDSLAASSVPAARSSPAVEKTLQSYTSPLQRLVAAAKTGDSSQLPRHTTALSARTIRLTEIANTAAESVRGDAKLVRELKTESSELSKLTLQVIEQAEEVSRDPQQPPSPHKLQQLEASTQAWAGHVRQLIAATQRANRPWSQTAEDLVAMAEDGGGEGGRLEAQVQHVSTQTAKMVDIATMTIAAAETEEAIGSMDESEPTHDVELQEQIKQVKVTMSEIEKLTPQMLEAAKQRASSGPEATATAEHLNLLSQEWATKAKGLLKEVDEVTLGMGGPADSLLLSAQAWDPGLLRERSAALKSLATDLETIADEAVTGCVDADRVEVVRVAARNVQRLAGRLVEVAQTIAREGGVEEGGGVQQTTQEEAELLKREWASQVHLLTAHIDDLTAGVAAPLDRLVDLALQAGRTSGGPAREHLLNQFESKAAFISEQLGRVGELFSEATMRLQQHGGRREPAVEAADTAITFLKRLTPHAVGAARSLSSDEPGSAMLEHFNHLRRQWAAKAQLLQASLQTISSANMEEAIAAFDELIHHSKLAAGGTEAFTLRAHSSEDISTTEKPAAPQALPRTPQTDPRPKKFEARPRSMAVPLPSWNQRESGSNSTGDNDAFNKSSQSIAVAAQALKEVTEVFEEGNPIVLIAKKMAEQMSEMAEYTRGRGGLQTKTEMIHTAKAIAANGQTIVRFANLLSDQCMDRRIKADLLHCSEMIPTLSTQLRIIASVKASTPDDTSADVMLVKNAQNLMKAVVKTVQAAESACMKGLQPLQGEEDDAEGEAEGGTNAVDMALTWKRKLVRQRTMEAVNAPRGVRGLRKLNRNRISTPSVVDYIRPHPSSVLTSPKRSYI